MENAEKLLKLFEELELPICKAELADNDEKTTTYQLLDGQAYITFDNVTGKAIEYHGGYD